MADLYVMQNDRGLIKIGRSTDVNGRRRALEATHGCEISLVAVFENDGHLEEQTHLSLDEYRIIGEWFEGNAKAKAAISAELDLPEDITWPHAEGSAETIEHWLSFIEGRRFLAASDREFSRLIRMMEETKDDRRNDPGRFFDTHIWTILNRFGPSPRGGLVSDREPSGRIILEIVSEGVRSDERYVPFYTSDLDSAMQIWPEADRPKLSDSGPWDCCIAGLRFQKARYAAAILNELNGCETDR